MYSAQGIFQHHFQCKKVAHYTQENTVLFMPNVRNALSCYAEWRGADQQQCLCKTLKA
jgi:hypothetical protein